MRRFIGAVCAAALVLSWCGVRERAWAADDKDPKAVLDKAIQALGGEEKLSKAKAIAWKGKGKISIMGNDNEFTNDVVIQGLDRFKQVFEGDFGGNQVKGVVVLAGDKGWRQFGDMKMEMDQDGLANQKRAVYLQVIPATLMPLREKGFKLAAAGEEQVAGKPAVGLKVTPADGKDFTLFFDKATGLPVKQVATVAGFMGDEFTQETSYADYKDFAGIKKATRIEA